MAFHLARLKWKWVVLGVVVACVIAYGSSICVVTGYATVLAFQSLGTPDMALINAFAAQNAEGIISIFFGLGTLVGGFIAGRKAQAEARLNGLAVGVLTAVISPVFGLRGGLSLWALVGVVLALAGGWAGGQLARARA
jgi:predicted alpha/beta hydrolase